jgi:hypothetical protein
MQKVGTAGIPSEQAQEQDPEPRQSSRGNRRSNREDTLRGRRGRRSDPIPWPVSRATHSRQDTSASPDLCSTRILSSSGALLVFTTVVTVMFVSRLAQRRCGKQKPIPQRLCSV